jgi:hypothetical protein
MMRLISGLLKNMIITRYLEYNGISVEPLKKQKQSISNCPKCGLVNQFTSLVFLFL